MSHDDEDSEGPAVTHSAVSALQRLKVSPEPMVEDLFEPSLLQGDWRPGDIIESFSVELEDFPVVSEALTDTCLIPQGTLRNLEPVSCVSDAEGHAVYFDEFVDDFDVRIVVRETLGSDRLTVILLEHGIHGLAQLPLHQVERLIMGLIRYTNLLHKRKVTPTP